MQQNRASYLGMADGDLDNVWYAKYWHPHMAPLPAHITEALAVGPQSASLFLPLTTICELTEPGYQRLENGFGLDDSGAGLVAALTNMPRVTPAMWDWWFSWHGSDSRRYKLWYPNAHLYAGWRDGLTENPGKTDREGYINRTSLVDEYIGSAKLCLAIRFVPPETLGFDKKTFVDPAEATIICARVGLSAVPCDIGYLVHYVRRTAEGAEMRSRFWQGGQYVASRSDEVIPAAIALRNDAMAIWQAYTLLAHCAKEMNHLAGFLPELYADYCRQL